jgi:hypothetical protein
MESQVWANLLCFDGKCMWVMHVLLAVFHASLMQDM